MATRMNYENMHDKAADDSINRGKVLMYIADMQQGVSGEYSDPVEAEKHEYAYQVLEWVFAGIKEMEPAEMPVPSDTIYRQAAIDKFEPWLKVEGYSEGELNMLKAVLYELKCLPSAHPERTGHWIEISSLHHTYKCSECGRLLVNITDGKNNVAKHYPYCHCGAKMEVEHAKV